MLKGFLKFASQGYVIYSGCPLMLAEGNSTGSDLQNSPRWSVILCVLHQWIIVSEKKSKKKRDLDNNLLFLFFCIGVGGSINWGREFYVNDLAGKVWRMVTWMNPERNTRPSWGLLGEVSSFSLVSLQKLQIMSRLALIKLQQSLSGSQSCITTPVCPLIILIIQVFLNQNQCWYDSLGCSITA